MKLLKFLILTVAAFAVTEANASERTEKICAKIKECTLNQPDSIEIPEQMKAIVTQVIDNQCVAMAETYDAKFEQAGLQAKATACVDSMVNQSCKDLVSSNYNGRSNTKACNDFEKAANDAGVDVSKAYQK